MMEYGIAVGDAISASQRGQASTEKLGALRDQVGAIVGAQGDLIAALKELDAELATLAPDTPGDAIQNIVFEIGKHHPFESLRHWFQALYEVLLGSSQGPRMGSFIALYGIDNSRKLIAEALASA